jgi:hypothetical protein
MLYYSYRFDAQLLLLPYRVGTEGTVTLSTIATEQSTKSGMTVKGELIYES